MSGSPAAREVRDWRGRAWGGLAALSAVGAASERRGGRAVRRVSASAASVSRGAGQRRPGRRSALFCADIPAAELGALRVRSASAGRFVLLRSLLSQKVPVPPCGLISRCPDPAELGSTAGNARSGAPSAPHKTSVA